MNPGQFLVGAFLTYPGNHANGEPREIQFELASHTGDPPPIFARALVYSPRAPAVASRTVFLIPDFGEVFTPGWYARQSAVLTSRGFHVVVPELVGMHCDRHSAPMVERRQASRSLAAEAGRQAAILVAIGAALRPFFGRGGGAIGVVGDGYGAVVALAYAAIQPRCSGVALVSPGHAYGRDPGEEGAFRSTRDALVEFTRPNAAPSVWVVAENNRRVPVEVVRKLHEECRHAGSTGHLVVVPAWRGDGDMLFKAADRTWLWEEAVVRALGGDASSIGPDPTSTQPNFAIGRIDGAAPST